MKIFGGVWKPEQNAGGPFCDGKARTILTPIVQSSARSPASLPRVTSRRSIDGTKAQLTEQPFKGNRWLRIALIEAALGAIRTKDSALAARYRRVMRHRGHNKAW